MRGGHCLASLFFNLTCWSKFNLPFYFLNDQKSMEPNQLEILSAYHCDKRTVYLMHEITLIFDAFQRAYYLRLVLQLQFFITSCARLEFSFKSLRVQSHCANSRLPLHRFSVQKMFFFFLKHLSLRMDLMCRGSKKYFALILYRLFSAGSEGEIKGNVN